MSRSGSHESASAGPSTGTGTAAQQADDITRNMILGLPKQGLDPQSPEAADLRAAEAFVSDIQQEIMAYDIANAKAMETYMRTWWSKVPFFGRHAKAALEAEVAANDATTAAAAAAAESNARSALSGLDAVAAAAAASGGAYLHKHSQTLKGGNKVERTAALTEEQLRELAKGGNGVPGASATTKPLPKMNSWLFKRNHPGWVPLMQRWWVPWVCVACIALVWTPDVWKLRTLYYLDHQYAVLRQNVHIAYWRLTMNPDEFEELMKSIHTGTPSHVKGTDCPF